MTSVGFVTCLIANLDGLGPLGEAVLHEGGDEDGAAAVVARGRGVALGGQGEAEGAAVPLQVHRERYELVPPLQSRVLGRLIREQYTLYGDSGTPSNV